MISARWPDRCCGLRMSRRRAVRRSLRRLSRPRKRGTGRQLYGLCGIRQDLRGIPQGLRGILQSLRGIPQGLRGIPQSLCGIPQSLRGILQSLRGIPQSLRGIPRGMRSILQSPRRIPFFFFLILRAGRFCKQSAMRPVHRSLTPDPDKPEPKQPSGNRQQPHFHLILITKQPQ
jgi:hypothetical protein